ERAVLNLSDVRNDLSLPELTRQYARANGFNSLLVVPLLRDQEAIGSIGVGRSEAGAFSGKQVALLQTFAAQAVIAIENVRLFDETQRLLKDTEQRAAELAIINSVQSALASKLDMQGIYEAVGDKIREIFKADTTFINIYDEENQWIKALYYVDNGVRPAIAMTGRPYGKGLFEIIVESGQPLMLSTLQEQNEAGAFKVASPGSGQDLNESFLGVPIFRNGKVIGVTSVQSYQPHAYTQNDLRLLTTLTNSMSVALESARLFDEVQRKNVEITEALEQQTATSEILRVIASSPDDVQPVLNVVAQSAARLTNSYDALIVRVENDRYHLAAQWGPVPTPLTSAADGVPIDRQSVTGRAIIERQIIHVHDLLLEPQSEYGLSKQFSQVSQQRTILAVPLMRDASAIGAIVIRRQEVNPFDKKQVSLLKTFADQAVIAIENVRLFTETQRLLKETEQRAAELAILNSVGEAMAKTLDAKTVTKIVGDKVRDIFTADQIAIVLYDQETNLIHFAYGYDKANDRYLDYVQVQPFPLGKGLTSKVIESRQPLLLGTRQEQVFHGHYMPPEMEGLIKIAESWLG
ncbi:MAG TPA: GAF domain-containing protein, partial [Anaerolineae bacterium]|nr:GAF domain-containing protein [Anaerolineae bacterium]